MHLNLLPLLGMSTAKYFSSIIHFTPISINLGVLIRKGDKGAIQLTVNTQSYVWYDALLSVVILYCIWPKIHGNIFV